ncbi:MAG: hypothetical protein HY840_08090 [Bacteroidetes bacterium]|nr:hypothetical protein [Bacteroidota bacterium]
MYKTFFLAATACFISLFASAQEGLLLRNNTTGKTWTYKKGSIVTYIKSGDEGYSTEKLNDLIDTSAVVLGEDTVMLASIAGIKKKSTLHTLTKIIGMPIMLIGSIMIADGTASIFKEPQSGVGISSFLLGAVIFTAGCLPYQLNLKNMNVEFRGEWTIKVYRSKPSPQ